jgi:hypothetical protein
VQREAELLEVDGCWYLFHIHEAGEDNPTDRDECAKEIAESNIGGANLESIKAAAESLVEWATENKPNSSNLESIDHTAAEITATKPTNDRYAALLRVFTNGLSDARFKEASQLLADDKMTANEKLTKIDTLLRFSATASAKRLGDLLGVTKQAVMKTDWWIQNRKGEKSNEIGRRQSLYQKRANQSEKPDAGDDGERQLVAKAR